MTRKVPRTLAEACLCKQFWGLTANRSGNSLDKPEDDFVKKYEEFRKKCPDASKASHASFCPRCDNSFPSQIGGANHLRKGGVVQTNPFEKFPEPLKPREGPKVSPVVWESLGPFIQRVPLAPKNPGAKIKELTEVTAQETNPMADNEATRALFRELLGMTSGGTAGGRAPMQIPQEIMDSLAGDAAQEAMARESLIMEMREADTRNHDPRFVSLDLMEMEASDVDSFLKSARKKIIKRSKPTRQACCAKIGGVLDQIMGAGGEEVGNLELQGVRDRGKMDPIGDVDSMAEAEETDYYKKHGAEHLRQAMQRNPRRKKIDQDLPRVQHDVPERPIKHSPPPQPKRNPMWARGASMWQKSSVDVDLFNFIAEEFAHWEHSDDCQFADPRAHRRALGESFGVGSPGLVRDALAEGEGMPSRAKLKKVYALLKQKKQAEGGLKGKEAIVYKRLSMILGGGGESGAEPKEESYSMGTPSKTAFALSAFMESSHEGGKGSPDPGMLRGQDYAGDMSRKQRDDNSEYPTSLMPAKSGGNKTAGAPHAAARCPTNKKHQPRFEKGADPIGENYTGVSRTAMALSHFMESSGQYAEAKKKLALRNKDAGDLDMGNRDDTRENLGGPLEKAAGKRGGLDVYDEGGKKARYEKDANPIGGAVPSEQSGRRMKK